MSNEITKTYIISNVVEKEKLREVQSDTLALLAHFLEQSYGPTGSNTVISGGGQRLTQYTKDGKTILNSIQLFGDIESTVKQDVYEITRSVVKNVGDGTTSAVILSHYIFEELKAAEEELNMTPFEIMRKFQDTVNDIVKNIRSRAKELDLDTVYKIALVSTNGNERFAESIKYIYERFGMEVFIDVAISFNNKTFTKEYNGLNLECGYMDASFVNSPKNQCVVQNPRIYAFTDPINNLEQAKFLDKIIFDNVMMAIKKNNPSLYHPTVILAPGISRDMSAYVDNIVTMFNGWNQDDRLPFCIISDIDQKDQYSDLIKLLGCKPISKTIDPRIYQELVEKGLAPTLENISTDFFGTCERFEADASKCKFINPKLMKDENGEYTNTFKNLVNFLESELKTQQDQGATAPEIGDLKRRIQSLKSNLVEFHVGGITAADRDSVRDLIEDAVLNIRSAAKHGYGFASNIEGLLAAIKVAERNDENEFAKVIINAYKKLIIKLYENSFVEDPEEKLRAIIESGDCAYDVFNKEFSQDIVSSIESDVAVLEGISKIITLLFTANQYMCESPAAANQYK